MQRSRLSPQCHRRWRGFGLRGITDGRPGRRLETERVSAEPLTERMCTLAARAGRVERCTEECPLFEDGECSLEALLEPAPTDEDAWAVERGSTPSVRPQAMGAD